VLKPCQNTVIEILVKAFGVFALVVSVYLTYQLIVTLINYDYIKAEHNKNITANTALAKILSETIWRNLHQLPVSGVNHSITNNLLNNVPLSIE
jgi:hypothetical protein